MAGQLKRMAKAQAKAWRAAERHRPVRAQWAHRAVISGLVSKVMLFHVALVLAFPLALMAAASLAFDIPMLGQGPWLATLVLGGFGGAVVGSEAFRRTVMKRTALSSVFQTKPPPATLIRYVRSNPRLARLVRGWVMASGDGALSKFEHGLIEKIVSASILSRGPNVKMGPVCAEPSEEFYIAFPNAPRFPQTPRGKELEGEYFVEVSVIDSAVGHLQVAQALGKERHLDAVLDGPCSESPIARSRL